MVWPLITVVIGELPGPMVKVLPSMTTADGPTENVSPPAVTVEKVGSDARGSGIVVVARPIPLGPIVTDCPLRTVVSGVLPGVI